MKSQSVWTTLLLVGFAATGTGFSQTGAESNEFLLKSVEWPGLGRTPAVCVEKDGWYVCVLPEGEGTPGGQPRIFNEAGQEQATKLLHLDRKSGICLLETEKVGSKENHLTLSTRSDFEPGQALTSLLPKGRLKTRLAGKDRKYLGEEFPSPMLRVRVGVDQICEPGTPLINEAGELEGIVANRKLPALNEGHAIPAGLIRKVIVDVEGHQKSAPVWVGMIFHADTSTPQVIEVKKDSPAGEAGVKPGDVILAVDSQRIGEFADLVEILKLLPGQKSASFKVLRQLEILELQIVPRFVE